MMQIYYHVKVFNFFWHLTTIIFYKDIGTKLAKINIKKKQKIELGRGIQNCCFVLDL